jgi:TonB family protein
MKILVAAGIAGIAIAASISGAAPAFAEPVHRIGAAVTASSASEPAPDTVIAPRTFPGRLSSAHLLHADLVAKSIRARHGDTLSAKIQVCVAPSGIVTRVSVLAGSGVPAFDKLVVDAAHGWAYQAYLAPPATRVCHITSLVYRAPPPRVVSRRPGMKRPAPR